mgnify:CR=1 FL=1
MLHAIPGRGAPRATCFIAKTSRTRRSQTTAMRRSARARRCRPALQPADCALRDQGNLSAAIACYRRSDLDQARSSDGTQQPWEMRLVPKAIWTGRSRAIRKRSRRTSRIHLEAHYSLPQRLQIPWQTGCRLIDCHSTRRSRSIRIPSRRTTTWETAFGTQGKLHEAIASHRRALALRPDLRTHATIWGTYSGTRRAEDAIDCYRKALEFKPDDAGAHNNLGNVLSEVGLIDTAVASYRRALELEETAEFKANFALCIRSMVSVEVDAASGA